MMTTARALRPTKAAWIICAAGAVSLAAVSALAASKRAGAWSVSAPDQDKTVIASAKATKGKGRINVACEKGRTVAIFFDTEFLRLKPGSGKSEYLFDNGKRTVVTWPQEPRRVTADEDHIDPLMAGLGSSKRLDFITYRYDYLDLAMIFDLRTARNALDQVVMACGFDNLEGFLNRALVSENVPRTVPPSVMEDVMPCVGASFGGSIEGQIIRGRMDEEGNISELHTVGRKTGEEHMLGRGAALGAVRRCAPYRLSVGLWDFEFGVEVKDYEAQEAASGGPEMYMQFEREEKKKKRKMRRQ